MATWNFLEDDFDESAHEDDDPKEYEIEEIDEDIDVDDVFIVTCQECGAKVDLLLTRFCDRCGSKIGYN